MVSRKQWDTDVRETRAFARIISRHLTEKGIPRATFRLGHVRNEGVIVTPSPSFRMVLIEPKYRAWPGVSSQRGERIIAPCFAIVRGLLLPVLTDRTYGYVQSNENPLMPAVKVSVPSSKDLVALLQRL